MTDPTVLRRLNDGDSLARPGRDWARSGFEGLAEAFDRALEEGPSESLITRHYLIAGRLARVRSLGNGLSREIERPLAHLGTAGRKAGELLLTIDLLDRRAEGLTKPAPRIPGLPSGVQTVASRDGRFVMRRAEHEQMVSAFDRSARRIVAYSRDTSRLTLYERGRPFHSFLLLWLQDNGIQPVHAGLVSRDGAGVLLAGGGGSGKSTVALSCLHAGFLYQGDDYIGLEPLETGDFEGYSLYCSTHVERSHLRRFPWLEPHARHGTLPGKDKSLALLSDVRPDQLSKCAAIKAIALPTVASRSTTSFRVATRTEALLRLAPSSILQLPFATGDPGALDSLANLIERVPVFWLDLGVDLRDIPGRVTEILERVSNGPDAN